MGVFPANLRKRSSMVMYFALLGFVCHGIGGAGVEGVVVGVQGVEVAFPAIFA